MRELSGRPSSRLSDAALPIDMAEADRLFADALSGAGRVLLAVSGGPDSVALMRLCAALAQAERERGGCDWKIEVATVDHGLRAASRAEAEEVGRLAAACGLPHAILTWNEPKASSKTSSGTKTSSDTRPQTRLQERARAARYALLASRAREIGADLLLTAHTLDDQAETVLMRIAHGSGLAGLAAMRPLTQRAEGLRHARPLLGVAKSRLVATCVANGWPFIEDPSNADPRFARARWRRLAPALRREGLTAERLAKLAWRAARAEEALETKAAEAFGQAKIAASTIEAGAHRSEPFDLSLDFGGLVMREPRDIVLRVLLLGLAELRRGGAAARARAMAPIRLERAESALVALISALSTRQPVRRTLSGALLSLDAAGRLDLRLEAPRRRGRIVAEVPNASQARPRSRPKAANPGNSNASMVLV